jgi:hypothetical protein
MLAHRALECLDEHRQIVPGGLPFAIRPLPPSSEVISQNSRYARLMYAAFAWGKLPSGADRHMPNGAFSKTSRNCSSLSLSFRSAFRRSVTCV